MLVDWLVNGWVGGLVGVLVCWLIFHVHSDRFNGFVDWQI